MISFTRPVVEAVSRREDYDLGDVFKSARKAATKVVRYGNIRVGDMEFTITVTRDWEATDIVVHTEPWNHVSDVGKVLIEDGKYVFEKEPHVQGEVVKDYGAWNLRHVRRDLPVYVPELTDGNPKDYYTAQDLIDICDGDEILAEELLDDLNWQHAETLWDELLESREEFEEE